MVWILGKVTVPSAISVVEMAPAAIVVAKVPVPEPVTSPVRVMVWSPVLVPERLEPVTAPEAATEVGVMLPRPTVMVPLVVIGLVPERVTPCAAARVALVTVPVPPVAERTPTAIDSPVPTLTTPATEPDAVGSVAHAGLAAAPPEVRTWPEVPGARAAHADAPR